MWQEENDNGKESHYGDDAAQPYVGFLAGLGLCLTPLV